MQPSRPQLACAWPVKCGITGEGGFSGLGLVGVCAKRIRVERVGHDIYSLAVGSHQTLQYILWGVQLKP